MATKARKAVDRAARAATKAAEAFSDLSEFIPTSSRDRHQWWVRELGEYASHLSSVTWPDQQ